jgi:ABC-type transport system involved in cytochrome bd biosynthesis fused ATPase/permease subunit
MGIARMRRGKKLELVEAQMELLGGVFFLFPAPFVHAAEGIHQKAVSGAFFSFPPASLLYFSMLPRSSCGVFSLSLFAVVLDQVVARHLVLEHVERMPTC